MTAGVAVRRMPLPSRPVPRRGRPVGAVGEVAAAMLEQALVAPGTARELSRRACVGDRVGMYTVSRLASAGLLVKVLESRPAVYAAPRCPAVCRLEESAAAAGAALSAFTLSALAAFAFVGGSTSSE